MSACDTAAYLFSLIKPSDMGHTEMTAEEKNVMAAWREQTQIEM